MQGKKLFFAGSLTRRKGKTGRVGRCGGRNVVTCCLVAREETMTPTGFDLPPDFPGKTAPSEKGAATSGADAGDNRHLDPDLALILERWDALSAAVRAGIAALVKAQS